MIGGRVNPHTSLRFHLRLEHFGKMVSRRHLIEHIASYTIKMITIDSFIILTGDDTRQNDCFTLYSIQIGRSVAE